MGRTGNFVLANDFVPSCNYVSTGVFETSFIDRETVFFSLVHDGVDLFEVHLPNLLAATVAQIPRRYPSIHSIKNRARQRAH